MASIGETGNGEAAGRPDGGDDEVEEQVASEGTKDRMRIAPGVRGQSELVVTMNDGIEDRGTGSAGEPGIPVQDLYLLLINVEQLVQNLVFYGTEVVG